jgi:hypothetical protein
MYDPEVGVWSGADPAEQDWNVYAYCGGSPTSFVDPDGLTYDSSGFYDGTGSESGYDDFMENASSDWQQKYESQGTDNSHQYSFQQLYDEWKGSSAGQSASGDGGIGDGGGGGGGWGGWGGHASDIHGHGNDMVDHSTWTAPPLKPMTNGDVAGLGKALLQGAMPGAPVQQGGGATQVCNVGESQSRTIYNGGEEPYNGGDVSWDVASNFIPLGKGVLLVGALGKVLKVEELAEHIVEWLGPEARMIVNKYGDKIFVNTKNGRKVQFHMKNPSPHESPHAHVEEGPYQSNPIYPTDVPHK